MSHFSSSDEKVKQVAGNYTNFHLSGLSRLQESHATGCISSGGPSGSVRKEHTYRFGIACPNASSLQCLQVDATSHPLPAPNSGGVKVYVEQQAVSTRIEQDIFFFPFSF